MEVIHLTPESFEKLTAQSEKALLVDFWATWCGPCQRLAPELEALAASHPEIIVGKVNVDDPANVNIAVSHGVDSIPALFFYRNGKLEKKLIGFMTKSAIESQLGL